MPSETMINATIMRQKKTALDVTCAQKISKTNSLFEPVEKTDDLESLDVKRQGHDLVEEKKRYMQARLLAEITENPEGVTLAEVAERIGVVPVVLGRASRDLLKRSKIHKAGKVYFPALSR